MKHTDFQPNSSTPGNAADTTKGCKMISYSHVEKDLNRNEYLKLTFE